jgi:glycosyltransferase 2 family protein
MARLARVIFLLVGVGLLAILVTQVDLAAVRADMREMGWALPLIFLPYITVYLCDTLGWRWAFGPTVRVTFGMLFLTRMAGEAINNLTPFAYLGGEPVKAHLLSRFRIPMIEGMAASIIAKLLISIAQFIFVSLGGILAMSHLATRPDILWALVGVVIVAGGFLAGVSRGLQRGLFMQLFRLLDRWQLTPSILERWRTHLRRLDETIAGFYHRHPRHLVLSLLFHILGWLLGGLEVYAIFYAVGRSIDLTEAIAIEALASVAKGLAFFIPGSLGVQEGGNVLILALFGFSASLGLTFSLLRRLRELVWISLGLLVLLRHYGWRSPRASSSG